MFKQRKGGCPPPSTKLTRRNRPSRCRKAEKGEAEPKKADKGGDDVIDAEYEVKE